MSPKYLTEVKRDIHRGGPAGDTVWDIQTAIDWILDEHEFDWRKIRRDKVPGAATFKEAQFAGWLLGFSRKRMNRIATGILTEEDQKYLRRDWERTDGMKKRDRRRQARVKQLRELHEKSQNPDPDGDGLAKFDGITVDAEFVPWLEKARKAGWDGTLTSGYRTPEYSESLCYAMCNQPSCPGRCAGKSSRHSQKNGDGAIDATDYYNLGQIFKQIGAPFYNALGAADPVHFSRFGN